MNAPLWRLNNVTVPGRAMVSGHSRPRLGQIHLEIPTGVTAILGPSGAGKTTLLNLLVGFERPRSGTVELVKQSEHSGDESPNGQTKQARLPVFWVPPGHGLWPHLTVKKHLESIVPDQNHSIEQLLKDFDLTELAGAYPATLSQGERDRLSLARAIASGAGVLVMDEPLAHVPDDMSNRYWSRLRSLAAQRKMSMVMATHDLTVAAREADYVILIDSGKVVQAGPTDTVLADRIQERS